MGYMTSDGYQQDYGDMDDDFDETTEEEIEAYKAECVTLKCKKCSKEYTFHPIDDDNAQIIQFDGEQNISTPNPEYAFCPEHRSKKEDKPISNLNKE